ncbi:hypothetical protein GIB67_036965 [Kingdonia uniflora]|uniref:Reticulon-like protein n=1 Tax=Kingdonia uniflora TaxID=39325 RepID=A0A7J7NVS8_9MAGN|nr:hypothetical protein GIB67_036965 [Kingdonia uniflora]
MEVGNGRRKMASRNVVAGSVWESRMKMDDVKGGIKVFNGHGEVNKEEVEDETVPVAVVVREKRRTWKPEPIEVIAGIPVQTTTRSDHPNRFTNMFVDANEENPICFNGEEEWEVLDEREKKSFDVKVVKEEKRITHKHEKPIPISSNLKKSSPIVVQDQHQPLFEKTQTPVLRKSPAMISQEHHHNTLIVKSPIQIKKSRFFSDDKDLVFEDCNEIGDDDDDEELVEREKKSCNDDYDKVVKTEKSLSQKHKSPIPISPNLQKTPPFAPNHHVFDSDLSKPPQILSPISDDLQRPPQIQAKLQHIVDLVLWRDIVRSALVSGFGAITLFSSSYTQDLNFSLVSVISYTGFLYLVAIFFYKSILRRGALDLDDSNKLQQQHLLGEEEAICLLKLVLPYLNDLHLKLKSLFSGDPTTTLKTSVLLFVLAQCGTFITIWNMVRLGFIGVFTVPKICSYYSTQLTQCGKTVFMFKGDLGEALGGFMGCLLLQENFFCYGFCPCLDLYFGDYAHVGSVCARSGRCSTLSTVFSKRKMEKTGRETDLTPFSSSNCFRREDILPLTRNKVTRGRLCVKGLRYIHPVTCQYRCKKLPSDMSLIENCCFL